MIEMIATITNLLIIDINRDVMVNMVTIMLWILYGYIFTSVLNGIRCHSLITELSCSSQERHSLPL
jgi:hypothetical protein